MHGTSCRSRPRGLGLWEQSRLIKMINHTSVTYSGYCPIQLHETCKWYILIIMIIAIHISWHWFILAAGDGWCTISWHVMGMAYNTFPCYGRFTIFYKSTLTKCHWNWQQVATANDSRYAPSAGHLCPYEYDYVYDSDTQICQVRSTLQPCVSCDPHRDFEGRQPMFLEMPRMAEVYTSVDVVWFSRRQPLENVPAQLSRNRIVVFALFSPAWNWIATLDG